MKDIFLKLMFNILKNYMTFTMIYLFNRKKEVEKLVANLHDKTEYFILIRNLKQALNHGFVLKKVHKVIKFNQKAWLKPHIDMNADLRKKTKNNQIIRTKLSQYKFFHRTSISNRDEKIRDIYE